MTAPIRIAAVLLVISTGGGCTSTKIEGLGVEAGSDACLSPPDLPDLTVVWASPTDMSTHVPRELRWDHAADMAVLGQVQIEIRFQNYTRAPSREEIEDVLSRTELLTWPDEETFGYFAERARSRGRGSAVVKLRPENALQDGWYGLRIAERTGFVEEGADAHDLGRGQLSRFHVGSCPLVVGVESLGDSGTTRVILSEVLDASSLRSLGLVSPDGVRNCLPRFSTDGLLSPGKKLDFDCDFAPTETGVRIVRDGSSGIVLPKGPRIEADDFRETNGSIKRSRLTPSLTEAMPDCNP